MTTKLYMLFGVIAWFLVGLMWIPVYKDYPHPNSIMELYAFFWCIIIGIFCTYKVIVDTTND